MALTTPNMPPMLDPMGMGLISDIFPSSFAGWPYGGGQQGLLPPTTGGFIESRTIPIDIIERDTEFVIRADIPGVKKEELRVSVDGDLLRIGHQRTTVGEDPSKREQKDMDEQGFYHRAERVSSFRGRNIRMPANADMDNVKCKYEDGVLSVGIAKKAGTTPTGGKEVAVE